MAEMKTFLKNLSCYSALSAVFFCAAPCSAEQEEIVNTLDGSAMAIFLSEEGYTRITVLESGNLVVHMLSVQLSSLSGFLITPTAF